MTARARAIARQTIESVLRETEGRAPSELGDRLREALVTELGIDQTRRHWKELALLVAGVLEERHEWDEWRKETNSE